MKALSLSIKFLTFDYDHPSQLARFWSEALDRPLEPLGGLFSANVPSSGNEPLTAVFTGTTPAHVPVTSRLHVEFTPTDGTLSDEVRRLIDLGARLVDDRRRAEFDDAGWVILADPAGNEFRVQSNDAEADAAEAKRALPRADCRAVADM